MLTRFLRGATAVAALSMAVPARAAPVDVAVVQAHAAEATLDVAVTGSIQARVQSDLAFRVAGKLATRRVDVGQHVAEGDVLATLDDAQERADLDNAAAQLAAKQAVLDPAVIDLGRQRDLFAGGYGTKKRLDDAQEAVTRAAADVEAARATLASTREHLSYTVLKSTGAGTIVARDVDVGAVVQAGTRVVTLALDGPRDAVFDVAEATAAHPPVDAEIRVALTTDPAVAAVGRVREVAPQVDPATSTVRVKVGLDGVPPAMTLGAAVVGSAVMGRRPVVRLPWSALDRWNGSPAVWVVDAAGRAEARPVAVLRYGKGEFTVADGVADGDRVVSAGIQFLRPGAPVAVVPGGAP